MGHINAIGEKEKRGKLHTFSQIAKKFEQTVEVTTAMAPYL